MADTYHNDYWTLSLEDLGYKDLGDRLVTLSRECTPPFAFAVCGGWGSGKSSMLRYIMASNGGRLLQLDPEQVFLKTKEVKEVSLTLSKKWDKLRNPRWKALKNPVDGTPYGGPFPCVWFNPWQHQFENNPLHALLHEIYNQFSALAKAQSEAKKLGNVVLNTGLKLLDGLIAPLKVADIQKAGEAYEQKHYLSALDSQRFPLHFEQAARHLASCYGDNELDDDARLIIFIDDLDRCQPKQAYKLLETIKLFLHVKHCVFIFGVDYARLIRELAGNIADFRDMAQPQLHAADYLDKMFQATIRLPAPRKDNFGAFVKGIVPFPISLFPDLLTLLSDILEKNPRKVKNFLNSLSAHLPLQADGKPSTDERTLRLSILVHYLRLYYPRVFSLLELKTAETFDQIRTVLNQPPNASGRDKRQTFIYECLRNDLEEPAVDTGEEKTPDMTLPMQKLEQQVEMAAARKAFADAWQDACGTHGMTASCLEELF